MALKTIAMFYTISDAHIARSKLESAGVKSFLFDENMVSANFLYANAVGGIKLKVLEDDEETALLFLNENTFAPTDVKSNSEYKNYCPECKSENTGFCLPSIFEVFGGFFAFGVPLWLRRKKRRCHDCGHSWKSEEL